LHWLAYWGDYRAILAALYYYKSHIDVKTNGAKNALI